MPELPEVESIRRQLQPLLVGRRIVEYWVDDHPHARISDVHLIAGRRILAVDRRGKFLLCPLEGESQDDARELVLHLGMTGSLRLNSPETPSVLPVFRHVRASFRLDNGHDLLFNDPRRFGRVSVVSAGSYAPGIPTLANIGPEPLSDAFDLQEFSDALHASRAPIKARLLDQRLVAGIGNIYADESLWLARIHPGSRRVGTRRAERLHTTIREVLQAAIEREGTTFRDYQMVNGASGRNASYLMVYGKAGQLCQRCGNTLRKSVIAGRGTTYCPSCQKI